MVTAKKNGVVFSGALGVDFQSKREATHRALTTSHSLLTYLRIEQEEYFNVFLCFRGNSRAFRRISFFQGVLYGCFLE